MQEKGFYVIYDKSKGGYQGISNTPNDTESCSLRDNAGKCMGIIPCVHTCRMYNNQEKQRTFMIACKQILEEINQNATHAIVQSVTVMREYINKQIIRQEGDKDEV